MSSFMKHMMSYFSLTLGSKEKNKGHKGLLLDPTPNSLNKFIAPQEPRTRGKKLTKGHRQRGEKHGAPKTLKAS